MGDGWVRETDTATYPMFAMEMKNRRYIEWVAEKLRPFTSKVSIRDRSDEGGVTDETYVVRMCQHPWLENLQRWYESGEKVFPDDIKLSPETLSAWYVSDGSYKDGQIVIYSGNEYQNKDKIESMFSRSGLPLPNSIVGRIDSGGHSHGSIRFTTENSKEIFEYMGEAPKGFKHKWPDND